MTYPITKMHPYPLAKSVALRASVIVSGLRGTRPRSRVRLVSVAELQKEYCENLFILVHFR